MKRERKAGRAGGGEKIAALDIPDAELLKAAGEAALAAERLPAEERFHAFMRGLPEEALFQANGAFELQHETGAPLGSLPVYLALLAQKIAPEWAADRAELPQQPPSPEVPENLRVFYIAVAVECLFRQGWFESLEHPPHAWEEVHINGAPATQLDRKILDRMKRAASSAARRKPGPGTAS